MWSLGWAASRPRFALPRGTDGFTVTKDGAARWSLRRNTERALDSNPAQATLSSSSSCPSPPLPLLRSPGAGTTLPRSPARCPCDGLVTNGPPVHCRYCSHYGARGTRCIPRQPNGSSRLRSWSMETRCSKSVDAAETLAVGKAHRLDQGNLLVIVDIRQGKQG